MSRKQELLHNLLEVEAGRRDPEEFGHVAADLLRVARTPLYGWPRLGVRDYASLKQYADRLRAGILEGKGRAEVSELLGESRESPVQNLVVKPRRRPKTEPKKGELASIKLAPKRPFKP